METVSSRISQTCGENNIVWQRKYNIHFSFGEKLVFVDTEYLYNLKLYDNNKDMMEVKESGHTFVLIFFFVLILMDDYLL